MLLKIHPAHPSERKIGMVADCLQKDGLIIFPTDSVYAMGCRFDSRKAVERMKMVKQSLIKKKDFTFIFSSVKQSAPYTANYDKVTFRILNNNLPGPFTFVMQASNQLPKLLKTNKKTLGLRIPDHPVPIAIVNTLNVPILTTSMNSQEDPETYETNPEHMFERYGKQVDIVIDSGPGSNSPTAIIELLNDEPTVLREGILELSY